jgi:hypothetical protein
MGKYPYFPSAKSVWKQPQEYEGESTPSNPASNRYKLYFKSDGQLYSLNSAGTESVVGGSLGSTIQTGEIDDNAITLAKIYHGSANTVIGFDGSSVPTEITPALLSTNTFSGEQNLNANNITNINYQDLDKISIPSNPSANHGRVYVKQIDANNDGIFIQIKKAGSFVEVQIA